MKRLLVGKLNGALHQSNAASADPRAQVIDNASAGPRIGSEDLGCT